MRQGLDKLYDFVSIGELADTTKQFLYLSLVYDIRRKNRNHGLDQVEQYVVQRARDYLGRVREGFVLSLRATDVTSRDELSYLLRRVLLDWEALSEELGLAGGGELDEHSAVRNEGARTAESVEDSDQESDRDGERYPADNKNKVEKVRDQLLAFGMAAIAIGMLPRLPQEEITFPKRFRKPPTYSDIPVPGSPGEMLNRIEEIEKMVWQFAAHDLVDLAERRYDPLRRTYGFFETSAFLVKNDSQRFGANFADSGALPL